VTAEQVRLVDEAAAAYADDIRLMGTTLGPLALAKDYSGYITTNDASALPLVQTAQADIETLRDSEATDAATAAAGAHAEYASQRTTAIVILVVGIAVAVSLGLVLASGIARGVRRLRSMAEALAAGDLTCSAGLTTRDELGQMGLRWTRRPANCGR
jgi:methyl-accepting chemotaxis protein